MHAYRVAISKEDTILLSGQHLLDMCACEYCYRSGELQRWKLCLRLRLRLEESW